MDSTRRSWLRGLLVTPLAVLASKLTLKAAQQVANYEVVVRVNGVEHARIPIHLSSEEWKHYEVAMTSIPDKRGVFFGVSMKGNKKDQYADDLVVKVEDPAKRAAWLSLSEKKMAEHGMFPEVK